MKFGTKFAFLLVLAFGLHIQSNGQTITFKMLKKMIASRTYKDSIMKSFKFVRLNHIPPGYYVIELETYLSPDSSKTIEFMYKDSAIDCRLWTKDLNLLQKIVADGQVEGFVRASRPSYPK